MCVCILTQQRFYIKKIITKIVLCTYVIVCIDSTQYSF